MKRDYSILGYFWGLLLLTAGCTNEYMQDVNDVCFESDVLPIFVSNCTESGCHNSTDKAYNYDLSSYESIVERGIVPGNYKESEIYKSLVKLGERMPYEKDPLSDKQIATIALWIEEGAEQTTCTNNNNCDTNGVTFSQTVMPILETYCIGCHSGAAPSGSISLENYAGVLPVVNDGSLLGSIKYTTGFTPMPQNADPLSDCAIAQIEQWINDGAQDN